jgi:SAM-dependent methyltransferase
MIEEKFSFIDYLAAKKSVDDRALNRQVLHRLTHALPVCAPDSPLHVLEIAAGIGTMLERLVDGAILSHVVYTAIDLQPAYIAAARQRLPRWAIQQGFTVEPAAENAFVFRRKEQCVTIILETADIFEFVTRAHPGPEWDLIIAHAFLDLVDIPALLPGLLARLNPAGLVYFTINFDGETIFLPEIDPAVEREIIGRFHGVMEAQQPHSGSRAGRRLFHHLAAANAPIIAAGSSDWVVFPTAAGYPAQEAFFLHCIIDTIAATLQADPPPGLALWLAQRHAQIERNELVYLAHQLDFLGTVKGDDAHRPAV